jgi:hypothetical protein
MERLGESFYWIATFIAGVIALWVVANLVFNADRGEPVVQVVPLVVAGIIWLLGRACRDKDW